MLDKTLQGAVVWAVGLKKMRELITFTQTAEKFPPNTPRFAIQRRGVFALNVAAFNLLGEPKAVVLHFDQKNRAIVLEPVPKGTAHSYPVRKRKGRGGYVVSGAAFCKHFGIDHSQTQTFKPYLEGKMLVVELKPESERKRAGRKSSAKSKV